MVLSTQCFEQAQSTRTKEQRMNDRRSKSGEEPKEIGLEGLVHEAGQTHGPQTDTQVSFRVASPGDAEALRGMFSRVSPETIYQRFHVAYPDVPERTLALMLDGDQHDKESLVAVAQGEIVGHAMYVRAGDSGDAEMAIVVEDGWQSKGVGKLLLRKLAECARRRGVQTFVGTVLMENRRMLGLSSTVFAEVRHVSTDGVFHFRAPLRTPEPADSPRILRRVA